jgi:hypothetical protein
MPIQVLVVIGMERRMAEPLRELERLGEPSFQEFTQLCGRLELWDRLQLLERRSERIGKAPDRPRPEFLILRLEVRVVHRTSQMSRSIVRAEGRTHAATHPSRVVPFSSR